MRLPGGPTVQRLLSQAYVELTFTLPAQYFTLNPMAKNMSQIGKSYLRKQVHDPEVRDKLTRATPSAASARVFTTRISRRSTETTLNW